MIDIRFDSFDSFHLSPLICGVSCCLYEGDSRLIRGQFTGFSVSYLVALYSAE